MSGQGINITISRKIKCTEYLVVQQMTLQCYDNVNYATKRLEIFLDMLTEKLNTEL